MLLTIIRKKQGETASTKKETEEKKKEKWILIGRLSVSIVVDEKSFKINHKDYQSSF